MTDYKHEEEVIKYHEFMKRPEIQLWLNGRKKSLFKPEIKGFGKAPEKFVFLSSIKLEDMIPDFVKLREEDLSELSSFLEQFETFPSFWIGNDQKYIDTKTLDDKSGDYGFTPSSMGFSISAFVRDRFGAKQGVMDLAVFAIRRYGINQEKIPESTVYHTEGLSKSFPIFRVADGIRDRVNKEGLLYNPQGVGYIANLTEGQLWDATSEDLERLREVYRGNKIGVRVIDPSFNEKTIVTVKSKKRK